MFKKFMKSAMALLLCAIMTANAGVGFVYAEENVGVEQETDMIQPLVDYDINLPIIKK